MERPIITSENYKGYNIEAVPDDNPLNPREDQDNVGIIAYAHRQYDLGEEMVKDPIAWLCEKLGKEDPGERGNDKLEELEEEFKEEFFALPLYLYDHSGISISTTPFSCPWDSGQIGWIYTTDKQLKKMGTPKDRVYNILEAEVKELDDYVRGEIYSVILRDKDDNFLFSVDEVDDLETIFSHMRGEVDKEIERQEESSNMC